MQHQRRIKKVGYHWFKLAEPKAEDKAKAKADEEVEDEAVEPVIDLEAAPAEQPQVAASKIFNSSSPNLRANKLGRFYPAITNGLI